MEYDQATHSFERFDYEGRAVSDDRMLSVGLQRFHYTNVEDTFDLTLEALHENHPDRIVSTSCTDVVEEILLAGQRQDATGEGRLTVRLAG